MSPAGNEIDKQLGNFDSFKQFIELKINSDKDYLVKPHIIEDNTQICVLNYLIKKHRVGTDSNNLTANDYTSHIDFVIDKMGSTVNTLHPVHQCIVEEEFELAIRLLKKNCIDINSCNLEGQTILSLTILLKKPDLLKKILSLGPQLHQLTKLEHEKILPLHLAISHNLSKEIRLLHDSGADLTSSLGPKQETSLLMAARLQSMDSLTAILDLEINNLALDAQIDNHTALEILCNHLLLKPNNYQLLVGIGQLLCCGAELPSDSAKLKLLTNHKQKLLKTIEGYLQKKPHLICGLVARCHLKNTRFHTFLYEDKSWVHCFRVLFGKPERTAFKVEGWVHKNATNLFFPTSKISSSNQQSDHVILFAEFVKQYITDYKQNTFTNPWSTMLWKIAQGNCTWEDVVAYATKYPNTRTARVFKKMTVAPKTPNFHEDLTLQP